MIYSERHKSLGEKMMKLRPFVLALALIAPASIAVAQDDDIASKIINDPGAPEVRGAKAKLVNDPNAQGGKALRVTVAKKGANAWDSVVESAVKKPIKAGDQLILAFQARLHQGDGGATTGTLPYNAVQLSAAPYSSVVQGSADIGPEWELQEIKGKADKDHAAGTAKVTIHLGNAKQTVDLGPIVLLNMGQ